MTPNNQTLLQPEEQVLSTLGSDGRRRWLRPKVSRGRFLTMRRVVAYALIAVFTLLPYTSINGKPAILLDIINRHFTLFGYTFLPTDTLLLALFMVAVLITIFLLTALFGRVWCGWACPQTVYMEFVYRPIERFFAGTTGKGGMPKIKNRGLRRVARYVTYFILSVYLAHTFLAYFVGVTNLRHWILGSPFDHPVAFVVMAGTTAMMMFDFCYFREQMCIIACPYGRFQSVLLDRKSLIISYDEKRGEPRGKMERDTPVELRVHGDCVDCHQCVTTCPTGIDIRKGLQMECIGCAQCVDACDAVMTKIGRATGLIRYSSQDAMAGKPVKVLRARVVLYPAVLMIVLTLFAVAMGLRPAADVTLLRNFGEPFTVLPSGEVSNSMRIKITNRTAEPAVYVLATEAGSAARIVTDMGDGMRIEPGGSQTEGIVIAAPRDAYVAGHLNVTLRITNAAGTFEQKVTCRMLGPIGAAPTPNEGDAGNG
ncbi:MAG: cytochrome c oxidase accessory protein CcoG [Phycisphaera sp.]|nr:cytochrome c oxidase accessory protein CcoG [Phycisphaera sp.]